MLTSLFTVKKKENIGFGNVFVKVKIIASSSYASTLTNMSSKEIINHEIAALALLSRKLPFWLHKRLDYITAYINGNALTAYLDVHYIFFKTTQNVVLLCIQFCVETVFF